MCPIIFLWEYTSKCCTSDLDKVMVEESAKIFQIYIYIYKKTTVDKGL